MQHTTRPLDAQAARHAKQDRQLAALQSKIARFCEARRIAEEAFDKFQASPDWAEMCERHGFADTSDFGDWTC